jgi:hypothetical protein
LKGENKELYEHWLQNDERVKKVETSFSIILQLLEEEIKNYSI